MSTENLFFKIGLSGISKVKQPKFAIKVDDVEYINTTLQQEPNIVEYFEFNCDLADSEQHTLEIVLLNKESADTILDDQGNIIQDLILSINSIEMDEIDLGNILWTLGRYYPIYPDNYNDEEQKKNTEITGGVDLGWNGSWKLTFQSPFYVWLLENM